MLGVTTEPRMSRAARLFKLLELARREEGVTITDEQCAALIGGEQEARRMAEKFNLECRRTEEGLRFGLPSPREIVWGVL